jgi:hypothetical protein
MERACTNVKEARDLLLHLSCAARLTHGIACFKQVRLNLRGQIVSVHDYYRVDVTQHMLLLLSQGGARLLFDFDRGTPPAPSRLARALPAPSFGRLGVLSAVPEIWRSFF